MEKTAVEKLIQEAISAPSGENCQPWRFEVSGSKISIFNIPERDLSLYNFNQRGSFVCHGALLENIAILASAKGFHADIKTFPDLKKREFVAEINLVPASLNPNPLAPYVALRSTNRKAYYNEELTDQEIAELQSAGKNTDGCEILFLKDQERKEKAAEALGVNERLIFENPYLHEFFFSHLRWTDEEEKKEPNGFFIKTLEIEGPKAKALKIFRHWAILRILNILGISKQIAQDNAKTYSSSAMLGAITISNSDDNTFVEVGRVFERIWLTATKLGLSFQPLTGVLFLMQRISSGDTEKFSPEQVEMVKKAYKLLAEIFEVKNGALLLIFRLGKSEPPSAHSRRLEPEIKFLS